MPFIVNCIKLRYIVLKSLFKGLGDSDTFAEEKFVLQVIGDAGTLVEKSLCFMDLEYLYTF